MGWGFSIYEVMGSVGMCNVENVVGLKKGGPVKFHVIASGPESNNKYNMDV